MDDPQLANPKTDGKASPDIRPFSGVILAGGQSQRMGRDKALIEVAGETQLTHQARVLRRAGAQEIIVVQHPDRPRPATSLPAGATLVWDVPGHRDAGPLAGFVAGIAATQCEWIALVAVDLPRLTPRWWRQLRGMIQPGVGAVGRRPDGFYEPLAAIYPRIAHATAVARLAAGEGALQSLVGIGVAAGWLVTHPMDADDLRELQNWNSGELPSG